MFDHLKHLFDPDQAVGLSKPDPSPLALLPEATSVASAGEECKLAFHPQATQPDDGIAQQTARYKQLVASNYRVVREIDIAYHHDQGSHRFINPHREVSQGIQEINNLRKVLEGNLTNARDRSAIEILRDAIEESRGIKTLIHDIAIEQGQALRGEPNCLDSEDDESEDPGCALHAFGVPSYAQLIPDID